MSEHGRKEREKTIAEWSQYKDSFLASLRSKETFRAYRGELESFLDGKISETFKTDEPSLSHCATQYILAAKKIDPSSKKILNPRTLNRRIAALTSFFKYLLFQGILERVPTLPKLFVVNKRSSTPSPTEDECFHLLSFLEGYRKQGVREYRNALFFLFLFLLALRKSEALNIRWSDIDRNKRTLTLIQKGGSVKVLPIPAPLFSLLLEYQTLVFERVSPFWSDWSESGFLFPSLVRQERKPLSSSAGYVVVCSLVGRALGGSLFSPHGTHRHTPHYTPHSFRKAFIEQSLERKVDLVSIANATGHSSIEMVKYYDTRDTLKNNAIHELALFLDWKG